MTIEIDKLRVFCNWPGCDAVVHVNQSPFWYGGRFPLEGMLKEHEALKGWLIRISTHDTVHDREDFCPEHGRCFLCKERKPRPKLVIQKFGREQRPVCDGCLGQQINL